MKIEIEDPRDELMKKIRKSRNIEAKAREKVEGKSILKE